MRWAAASRIGTSHIRSGQPKQDAFKIELHNNDEVLFAVVADGAGSAERGKTGAALFCRMLAVHVTEWFTKYEKLPDNDVVWEWIDAFRDRIAYLGKSRELPQRQFACTTVALIYTPREFLAFQVGDSVLVGKRDNEWLSVLWPENGEYASSTYFVTDSPIPRLNIVRGQSQYEAFALFSDGINEIALENEYERPFNRFFDPMIAPVRNAEGSGEIENLSQALGKYLESPSVCDRTDDDKTLILVSIT